MLENNKSHLFMQERPRLWLASNGDDLLTEASCRERGNSDIFSSFLIASHKLDKIILYLNFDQSSMFNEHSMNSSRIIPNPRRD